MGADDRGSVQSVTAWILETGCQRERRSLTVSRARAKTHTGKRVRGTRKNANASTRSVSLSEAHYWLMHNTWKRASGASRVSGPSEAWAIFLARNSSPSPLDNRQNPGNAHAERVGIVRPVDASDASDDVLRALQQSTKFGRANRPRITSSP